MNRRSLYVKIGRAFQRSGSLIGWLDLLLLPFFRGSKAPVFVFVLAPPRSGSTLTYQVLRTALGGAYLSNMGNLLYTTPLLTGLVSHILCRARTSTYRSEHGLVSGICGEAEGLRFWDYWTGIGLRESRCRFDKKRSSILHERMCRLNASRPFDTFVAGFLGHVFAVEQYRRVFDKALFVHLVRDPVSNAASLLEMQPKVCPAIFSTLPKQLEKQYRSRRQQIVDQVDAVHRAVLSKARMCDTLHIGYESLCRDPEGLVAGIIKAANEKGFPLDRQDVRLPQHFPYRVVDSEYEHYEDFRRRFQRKGTYELLERIGDGL
jgi:hypothetical protein